MRLASTARWTCVSAAPREYSTWCAAVTISAASFGDISPNGRLSSGSSAGASLRYQRMVPSATARTAARSGRECESASASSDDLPSCTTACTASAAAPACPRPGAWRGGARQGEPRAGSSERSCAEPQAVDTDRVGEIARRNRPLAGALQFAQRDDSWPQAMRKPSSPDP
jgi:hypothetical protein